MTETGARRAPRFDPDRVAELEAERDFLLRSLDDLEVERENGNLDVADYERLKDDYTARAAAVLRALRDGIDARPVAPPISTRRRWVIGGVLALFAVVVGALLAGALGSRVPGGSATGNSQLGGSKAASKVEAHMQKGAQLVQKNDLFGALKEFNAAYKLDPRNAAARAYSGWMVFQLRTATGSPDEFLAKSISLLDQAIALDPSFPDAHFFKGVVLLQGKNDQAGADAELQKFLAIVPSGPDADRARALLSTTPTTRSP